MPVIPILMEKATSLEVTLEGVKVLVADLYKSVQRLSNNDKEIKELLTRLLDAKDSLNVTQEHRPSATEEVQ
jgi:hypothetical protein